MSPAYGYEAFARDGTRTKGRIEATTKSEAYDRLQKQALVPVEIFETGAPQKQSFWQQDISLSRRVSASAKAGIARELGLLLRAGIPLDRCLQLILQKTANRRLNAIMTRVRERVVAGASFPAALAEEPDFFEGDEIAIIWSGERGGDLSNTLTELADALDRRSEIAARLSSALLYPAILLVVSLAAVIVIVVVLVPNLEPLFESSGAAPPTYVAALMWLSHVLSSYWLELTAVAMALVVLAGWGYRQPAMKAAVNRWAMKLPFFGTLAALSDSTRFCRALASLLRSGTPLLQAMEAAGGACHNPSSRDMIALACRDISSGKRLAAALERFEPMSFATRQLIAIGEEANRLEDMLLHAAKTDEATVYRKVEQAMTLLTPAMTLMIGGLVGGLIVSVMRAIMSVNDLALQ